MTRINSVFDIKKICEDVFKGKDIDIITRDEIITVTYYRNQVIIFSEKYPFGLIVYTPQELYKILCELVIQ